jgi:hypothetical protein
MIHFKIAVHSNATFPFRDSAHFRGMLGRNVCSNLLMLYNGVNQRTLCPWCAHAGDSSPHEIHLLARRVQELKVSGHMQRHPACKLSVTYGAPARYLLIYRVSEENSLHASVSIAGFSSQITWPPAKTLIFGLK